MGAVQDFHFVPIGRRPRRRRGLAWLFMVIVYGTGPVVAVGGGIYAFVEVREAMSEATELSNSTLSGRDREALGIAADVDTLFEADAPGRIAALFEDALAGEPTRFSQILLYPDYAMATVQDPTLPTNLDRYTWRSGAFGTPSAQESGADIESTLFGVGDINWVALAQVAAQSPSLAGVDGGTISHVVIEHSTFQPTLAAVVRIFVSGDRGSGFVELAPSGEIIAVH